MAVRDCSRTTSTTAPAVLMERLGLAWAIRVLLASTSSSSGSAMVCANKSLLARSHANTFSPVTPILGAIIADQYLGKYNTILIFAGVYWVGLLILWASALPASIAGGHALGGYIAAIIIIGFGTGGIKSNIAPLIADQYQRRKMAIKIQKSGERTIIDPAITYQRIYMVFYWCINLGSLSLIATPFMEKEKGFWTAFLLCFCAFNIGILVLILRRKSYVVRPPQGQIITDAFKAIGIMIKARNTNAPKPTWRAANNVAKPVPWNDHFIDELQRALKACKVFIFCKFPTIWWKHGHFADNEKTPSSGFATGSSPPTSSPKQVSFHGYTLHRGMMSDQEANSTGQMQGYGMPNDFMQNFDPISILVFTPLLDRVLYPILRRRGIELRPIMRICIGFSFAALCMAYAAIVQHLVYSAGPCYKAPGACPAGMDGETKLPNNVHIAIQTPAYVFIGLAEIFISVTGLEYAYTKAPPSMKSFVQSIYLFTNALGSALNEALIPVLVDPKILWMYTGISIFTACTAVVFWFLFHHYDDQEEKMYDLDRDLPTLTAPGQKTAQQVKEENL